MTRQVDTLRIHFFYFAEDKAISEVLINEEIDEMEIRLIGSHGEQVGIMKTSAALQIAWVSTPRGRSRNVSSWPVRTRDGKLPVIPRPKISVR